MQWCDEKNIAAFNFCSCRAAVPDNKDFFTLFGTCHLIGKDIMLLFVPLLMIQFGALFRCWCWWISWWSHFILTGMTSACTNPVLYGFLNESFKKEFKEMYVCAIVDNCPPQYIATIWWMRMFCTQNNTELPHCSIQIIDETFHQAEDDQGESEVSSQPREPIHLTMRTPTSTSQTDK